MTEASGAAGVSPGAKFTPREELNKKALKLSINLDTLLRADDQAREVIIRGIKLKTAATFNEELVARCQSFLKERDDEFSPMNKSDRDTMRGFLDLSEALSNKILNAEANTIASPAGAAAVITNKAAMDAQKQVNQDPPKPTDTETPEDDKPTEEAKKAPKATKNPGPGDVADPNNKGQSDRDHVKDGQPVVW